MALGAQEGHPDVKVAIVPVGLNYFHGHRFRSRAYVEFGDPIYASDVKKRKEKRRRRSESILLPLPIIYGHVVINFCFLGNGKNRKWLLNTVKVVNHVETLVLSC